MGRGEERGRRARLGRADDHGALRADRVHNHLQVVDAPLQYRYVGDAVRQAGAALVEEDQPRERREPLEEVRGRGLFPPELDVRDEARDEDEIAPCVAERLVRDVDVVRHRVARRRWHGP